MPLLEAAAAAVATKLVTALVNHVTGSDGEDVVGQVTVALGSAANTELKSDLTAWFRRKDRSKHLAEALQAAVARTESAHPAFVRVAGDMAWTFLESQATDEMALALVPGRSPDAGLLAKTWARSWGEVDPDTLMDRVMIAQPVMATLVDEWGQALDARPVFDELRGRRTQRATADSIERIADRFGAASPDEATRLDYLRRVRDEHEFVDTTGAATIAAEQRITLEAVYVGLSALPAAAPDDLLRAELDELRAHGLDRWGPEYEAKVDSMIAKSRHGPAVGVSEPPTPELLTRLVNEHSLLAVLGDAGSGKTTLTRVIARWHAIGLLQDQSHVRFADDPNDIPTRFPIYVRAGSIVQHDGWKGMDLLDFLAADHKTREYPHTGELRGMFKQALDNDPTVRESAAQALGQLGDRSEPTLTMLRSLAQVADNDPTVRVSAVQALGRLGDRSEPTLTMLRSLAHDTDPSVRGSAADSLRQLGDIDTAAPVLRALAQDPDNDQWVRQSAVEALRQLGDIDTAVPALRNLVQDPDNDPNVRGPAVQALGRLGDRSEPTLTLLRSLVQDPDTDPWLRASAAEALGRLGDRSEPTLTLLRSLARNPDTDPWVRQSAAEALRQLGDIDTAVTVLRAVAQDPDTNRHVRRLAAEALGQLVAIRPVRVAAGS